MVRRCKLCKQPTKNTPKKTGQLCNRCFSRLPENRIQKQIEKDNVMKFVATVFAAGPQAEEV